MKVGRITTLVARHHLREGLHTKTAVKKGVTVALQWALAPILPRPLVWLFKKTLVPFLSTYINVKVNRAAINMRTNKQGRLLNKAATEDERRQAFYKLSSI